MHTVVVLVVGFGVLGLCALIGRLLGGVSGTPLRHSPSFPCGSSGQASNMYMGVKRAGYTLADEAPIFVLVYAIPAAAK
jgi:hypothetical protein